MTEPPAGNGDQNGQHSDQHGDQHSDQYGDQHGGGDNGQQSGALGGTPPGLKLAGLLDAAAGAGEQYTGLADDELMAGLAQWNALEAWVVARKLAAICELIRRNPEDGHGAAEPGGLPPLWRRDLCEEVACELVISRQAADKLIALAWTLVQRLPLTLAALRAGILDLSRVRLIADETSVLSDADAGLAEAAVAGWWAGKTWSQLQKKIAAAVVNIDPEGTEKRRERAARDDARVRFWRERSGNFGMGGYELPADQALKANQNIQRRARQYKAWGIPETLEILRVMAYLDLINQVDSRDQYPKAGTRAGQDSDGQDSDGQDSDGQDSSGQDSSGQDGSEDAPDEDGPDEDGPSRSANDGPEDDGPEDDGPEDGRDGGEPGGNGSGDGSGGGPGGNGGEPAGNGLAANVDLTIPLATLLELARRAGEAHGLGVIDAALACQLAAAAARDPRSSFTIIVLDASGHAVGYGHAARKRRPAAAPPPRPGPLWPAHGETRPDTSKVTFTLTGTAPAAGQSEQSGYGNWSLTIGDLELTVTIDPIPAQEECDHRFRTEAYRPTAALRRLVEIRDGECSLPVCVRHPRGCEWEHTIPWPRGETCACNGAMRCKHDHRIKEKWQVRQLPGGIHQWTSPSGRTYTKGPKEYPD